MANKQLTNGPWLDILPPTAPVDQTLLITLLVLGVMGLLMFVAYQLWQARPKQRALRQLNKLQRQLEQQTVDDKHCLYEINRLLCHGLGVHRLSQLDTTGHEFYKRLSRLQYRPAPPEHELTRQLLAEACLLLRGSRG